MQRSMGTRRPVVFVVDDDEDLLELLGEVLERAGYVALVARDGREALSRMRGIAGPTVAVVDLAMPGMDGRELVAAMRGDPGLARIPIIVHTAASAPSIDGVPTLRKPANPQAILQAVERSLAD